jgi:N-acetylglucosaminyldiphosphoundecaprenol N-acetyl-beta-D-mannosaminyltransferase
MFIEAYDQDAFLKVVQESDIVCPDGKPLAWATKLLHGKHQDRVAGMDLMGDVIDACANRGLSVFFLGTTEKVLNAISEKCASSYPSLNVAGVYAPPFAPIDKIDIEDIAQRINSAKPNIIFVALGCPKQEMLMHRLKPHIKGLMLGVGGAFPVFMGQQKRAPQWMQQYALEWLFRLLQEPKRLFKRYAYTNTKFLLLVTKELIMKPFNKKA